MCWDVLFVFPQKEYGFKENIGYYNAATQSSDAYIEERCKLDVYYPKDTSRVATVVWFHGDGLEGSEIHIPNGLLEKGVAVVTANYRMHPKVKHPVYIQDAAAAVA